MENVLFLILGLAYYGAVLALLIKEKFRIFIPIMIITMSLNAFVLGLTCQYSLSSSYPITLSNIIIPYIIGVVMFILAISSFFIHTNQFSAKLEKKPSIKRWIFFTTGILFVFIGFICTCIFWYTPYVFGSLKPLPLNGIISNIILTFISAIFLYYSTRINSKSRPNLMRKIVISVIFLFISSIPISLSLILIYAFPINPKEIFPFEAGISLLPYIIWSILLLLVLRESADKKQNRNAVCNNIN